MKMQKNMQISVVVPVYNEEDNLEPLIEEIEQALSGKFEYEIVYVNDGSNDGTLNKLTNLQKNKPHLRILHHKKSCGQSTAIHTGVHASKGEWIATLDGDGQNDPANIPALYSKALSYDSKEKVWLIAGWRKKRKDSWLKRVSSKWANAIRQFLLKDNTPDTGCGIKLFRRDKFILLPYFDHMHRYLPALIQRSGGNIKSVEVNHRVRQHGISKYGFHNRLWVGIVDLFGVSWLLRRSKIAQITELSHDD